MAASTTPGAVVVRGLTKRYGNIVALDRLDLDVPAGSIFGFLGPNGAGKTTTLRLLTGLGRPTAGTAIVDGIDATTGSRDLKRRIGCLDQDPRYYSWLTGRELLTLVGRCYDLDGRQLRARVDEVLGLVGLAEAADRRIGGYSGGMRQRLGVGQAVLPRPAVLFLDEPASALDPAGRRDVLELIASFRGSMTVVMSTHILGDVERICDRVGILDRGRLVTEGPMEALLEQHAQPIFELDPEPAQIGAVAGLVADLRAASWVRDVREEQGVLRVVVADATTASKAILPLVGRADVSLSRFERVKPSLEDVFLRVVGADRLDGQLTGGLAQ
jgi:ABC-2 type transport system ATP-binding protein